MIIFDSHTHVQFPAYDRDREEVIRRALENGVKMITVGTNYITSADGITVAEKYPDKIWATVGFHPAHVDEKNWYFDKKEGRSAEPEKFDINHLRELAVRPRVVAIGECGLDYFRIDDKGSDVKEKQREVFVQQIELAESLNKPLMIHCRPSKGSDDAYEDLLSILKQDPSGQSPRDDNFLSLRARRGNQLHSKKICHFFVGSRDIAKRLLEIGCYFTFGGVITFSRDYDKVINDVPLEKIMLETDAPYVAPEPHRGGRNEPTFVIEVAKKIAEIKGVGYEEVVEQTTKNVKSVFNIS